MIVSFCNNYHTERIMEIIATINPWNDLNYLDTIKHLTSDNINILRINTKTSTTKIHFIELLKKINDIADNFPTIKFLFDTSIPRDTIRTQIYNPQYKYIAQEGDIFHLIFSNALLDEECSSPQDYIYLKHDPIKLNINEEIIYGDGQNRFEIIEQINESTYKVEVMQSGTIWGNTSLHFKNNLYDLSGNLNHLVPFLEQIPQDKIFAIALSFIEKKQDFDIIKKYPVFKNLQIISKIESDYGMDALTEISDDSNFLMLGRGDLFFNTQDISNFFQIEKDFVKFSKTHNKKSIIATDIMSSLENSLVPRRGEIIDLILLKELDCDYIAISSHLASSDNIIKKLKLIQNIIS